MDDQIIDSGSGSQQVSVLSKISGIFTNPRTAFKAIEKKPDWWIPLTLVILVSVLSVLLTTDLQKQAQLEFINNSEIIPEERKADMLDNIENQGILNTMVIPAISSMVGILLYYVVIAAGLLLFGNFIYGGNSSFKNMFFLSVWGGLIGVVESLIKIPLMLSKGSLKVFTSPAILMNISESNSVMFKLLDAFDFFTIWKIVVFSIGFSVFYKISKGKSYTAIVSLYVVYLIVSISLSQLFKGFIS